MDYYVRIDESLYLKYGEVKMIGAPKSWVEIMANAYNLKSKGAFHIHRPETFFKFIEAIGGKKGEVATYILRNKDPRNICMLRVEDVANGAGVAIQTASDTLKLLRKSDSIKSISGAFMVNPGIDRIGDRQREAFLMKLYDTFDQRTRQQMVDESEEDRN